MLLWLDLSGLSLSAVVTLALVLYSVEFLHGDRFFRTVLCLTGACLSFSSFFWLLARFGL